MKKANENRRVMTCVNEFNLYENGKFNTRFPRGFNLATMCSDAEKTAPVNYSVLKGEIRKINGVTILAN